MSFSKDFSSLEKTSSIDPSELISSSLYCFRQISTMGIVSSWKVLNLFLMISSLSSDLPLDYLLIARRFSKVSRLHSRNRTKGMSIEFSGMILFHTQKFQRFLGKPSIRNRSESDLSIAILTKLTVISLGTIFPQSQRC